MKYFIFSIISILTINCTFSQCFINKGIGGIYDDQANSIAVDNSGNIFITGSFQGTVDFNPGSGSFNLTSLNNTANQPTKAGFLCKFDSNGNFIWAKKTDTWGGTGINSNSWNYSSGSCEPKKLAIDNTGNLYITGNYSGSVAFNAPQTTSGFIQGGGSFVWKLDNNGNFLFVKEWVATVPSTISANSICIDNSSNIYVTGGFKGTVDILPGTTTLNLVSSSSLSNDAFIIKLSSSGGFTGFYLSFPTAIGESIAVNLSGNILVTGGFVGTVDFDILASTFNLTSNGGTDIFAIKLASNGALVKAISIGGANNDSGESIAVDLSGNIHTTGYFAYPTSGTLTTVDFDPGTSVYSLAPVGPQNVYVNKFDSNLNFIWAKKAGGGALACSGLSLALDNLGNVYTTGFYSTTVDFDPGVNITNLNPVLAPAGSVSATFKDIFIWKLNSNGDFVWANSYGGNGEDTGLDICTDSQGNVYSAGFFSNIADFDPGSNISNLVSNGSKDIYFQKIQPDIIPIITPSGPISFCPGGSVTLTSSSLTGNTWSTGETTQSITVSAAGTYSVALSNGTCVTNSTPLSVTFLAAPSLPTITANGPITFCSGGNVVLTSSISSGNIWSNGATTQSITVNSNGNYTVTVSNGTCSNSSMPMQINVIAYPAAPTIIANGPVSFCPGENVLLTSNSLFGNTWSNGETSQSIIVNSAGTYTVALANGNCVSNSNAINVSLFTAPSIPIISANGSITFCSGDSVILNSSSSIGNIWSNGSTSQSIVVSSSSTYFISVSNGTCSTLSDTTEVSVIQYPSIPIISTSGSTTFCFGDSVILSSNEMSGNLWSNGSSNQSITVFTNDIYSVSVSSGGCVSSSDSIIVTTNPLPAINTQPANAQVNIGNQAIFTISSNGGTYQWQVNSGSGFQDITNGGQYTGATTNTLTISNSTITNDNNQFRCIVKSNNCSTTSNSAILIVIDNVGLEENSDDNLVILYPNPTNDFFNLKSNKNLIGSKYEILDNLGRVILSSVISEENLTIDLENASSGIYNLVIYGENVESIKLIKK